MAEKEYEYGKGVPMVLNPSMVAIESLVEDIRYRGQLISRNQKLESGVGATGVIGISIGFVIVMIAVLVPPYLMG
ncbi:MAG: tetrahydromethanopterin S-methyltransferase subunit mtrF [Candidatus Methanoperedens nitroreducens]|uniref:Tetrahydromethanopterin S-methyltransferase subunit mtrF n=1 Tax=Candidatus Methanoperedens nitratireducens TaxID=1392998 RepID=A0A0N8KQR1_9EURY|nr:tetrahydromethanopterin S-methyltransferase subunit F [Candidatus Methanoperedens sp. BLZ2]KAB2945137.1 MAG: tetrahydromethanopterin S-methyltransferase subunit F [Candidatus Methanoperedens sp.]KPQ42842.1 MAG: tetrahydromethanopterin S-methyltransferase subunit mtrF [Candidatus Methanoperedens sp. BLZ1]MBZ0176963.1 tetrahydromethanopterin S-methyltransferase subunit F [Candidatus Methanoperedens nitroreducens]MCX9078143.1 tetrahydromethanopterin S-methyltransferase subunit F [Candidatus Met